VIWVDLSTAPDPLFFRPLVRRFRERGHDVWITARDYGQTAAVAEGSGLEFELVGRHGGASLTGKAGAIVARATALARAAAGRTLDLAVSFNSYAQALTARRVGVPFVTLTDYEYQPANHLAFRLARRIIVPEAFDRSMLRRYGARQRRVVFFHGLKEDVTLADFEPDPQFPNQLVRLGVDPSRVVVTMRPPATSSTYHRFANEFFYDAVRAFAVRPGVDVLVFPRYPDQAARLEALALDRVVVARQAVDGLNLAYWSDAVVSAGGSMCREGAALGTPAYSVFAGRMAGVDRQLIDEARLVHLQSTDDLAAVVLRKRQTRTTRIDSRVIDEVLAAILTTIDPGAS